MSDILSKQAHSQYMKSIKTKNINIELKVRKWLFSHGYRYRINVQNLPGTPNIVLKKHKSAIFIKGCFWYGHSCNYGHIHKSNTAFWEKKINKNKQCDMQVQLTLQQQGWKVITVWKYELRNFDKKM